MTSSVSANGESLERIRAILSIWSHNRRLYPGWVVLPPREENAVLRQRTEDWERPILDALPSMDTAERLKAIRELIWRKDILGYRLTIDIEHAARTALEAVDCKTHTISGTFEERDDWPELREAWLEVCCVLIFDARFDSNCDLFMQRLESLQDFSSISSEADNRVHHERCLWAAYSSDFENLNILLDAWDVKTSGPIWLLRKAALLTEVGRHDESNDHTRRVLNELRQTTTSGESISSASLRGWALASTINWSNRNAIRREWEKLVPMKCDVREIVEDIEHTLRGAPTPAEPSSFDLGIRRSIGFQSDSPGWRNRQTAAYGTVRLIETAGLPPVNSSDGKGGIPSTIVSGILSMAAEELATFNPELAIRLVLRISKYDRDNTLQNVLSRRHLATLSSETSAKLAWICIRVIKHSLEQIQISRRYDLTNPSTARLGVALEMLSRLVFRAGVEVSIAAFEVGLDCYRSDRCMDDPLLGRPIRNLFDRTWETLSRENRANYVLTLLQAPISGFEGYTADNNIPDMSEFVSIDDCNAMVNAVAKDDLNDVLDFLIKALKTGDTAREFATRRLLHVVLADILEEGQLTSIAKALWDEADPIIEGAPDARYPLDWIYMLLPELEQGQAEHSFRSKWLTPNISAQSEGVDYSSRLIAQVGHAVSLLKQYGAPLELSLDEQEYIATHIKQLVDMFFSGPIRISFGGISPYRNLGSLLADMTIPEYISQDLFPKVRTILDTQMDSRDSIRRPVYSFALILGFALIPGFIRSEPGSFEELMHMVKDGIFSDSEERVSGAIRVLASWIQSDSLVRIQPIPQDLIREVGSIVAVDRRIALADALQFATLVFDRGSDRDRETMAPLVLNGLSFLNERLTYDSSGEDSGLIDTLKYFCVQLTTVMSQRGYQSHDVIAKWLDIGRNDPFPEIRKQVMRLNNA